MMRTSNYFFNRPWIIWRLKMTGVVMMKTRLDPHRCTWCWFLVGRKLSYQISCPKSKETWQAILICLSKQNQTFTAGEEIRLAQIPVYQARPLFYLSLLVGEEIRLAQIPVYLLLKKKVSSQELTEWISKLDFPNQEPLDYFRWLNLQHFLSSLYF